MNRDLQDTFNLALVGYLLRDVTLLPLTLAFTALAFLGIIGGSRRKNISKPTDEYDRTMMADTGTGSAFAAQRARAAHNRFHSTALPPASN